MAKHKQMLGKIGENLAANFLISKGFEILERNFRTDSGEIDLIVRDSNQIVFVEVKTRTSTNYGMPEEAVTLKKQQHLINSAQEYIDNHAAGLENYRIDVISILMKPEKHHNPEIEWFENAIS